MVGYQKGDDAAVFMPPPGKAIVQTVDFFTPMVDDPYIFGQITAANSLSDIYAMGGDPQFALNIVGFPICSLPAQVLKEILKGAAQKLTEAGVSIAGGHSIDDPQPKYGLCVTGFVNPEKIWRNDRCDINQDIIITKPLGTGIITTAIKGEMADEQATAEAIEAMITLNKKAKETIEKYHITCCTDITGFGLVGHSIEIARGSEVDIHYNNEAIPLIHGAREYASYGLIPGAAYKNMEHFKDRVKIYSAVPQAVLDIIHDPQTSGGLLFACNQSDTAKILLDLHNNGVFGKHIGQTKKGKGEIHIY